MQSQDLMTLLLYLASQPVSKGDGSIVIEVDTNAKHLLYDGKWYKRQ